MYLKNVTNCQIYSEIEIYPKNVINYEIRQYEAESYRININLAKVNVRKIVIRLQQRIFFITAIKRNERMKRSIAKFMHNYRDSGRERKQ